MVARAWFWCQRRAPVEPAAAVEVEEPAAAATLEEAWTRLASRAIARVAELLRIRLAQTLFNQSGIRLQSLSADDETFARCRLVAKRLFVQRGRQLRTTPKIDRATAKRVHNHTFRP
jgi:hypothetical protein